MTTTELIKLLKSVEFGASGRAREISIYIDEEFISEPIFKVNSAGDGIVGAELNLKIERGNSIMKKAMLSQPMAGKTDEEIIITREKAINTLTNMGYEIVNTLFTSEWYSNESMTSRGVVQIPLCFLAKSLENMSLCHTVYFCKGWENARGCRIEHESAKAYGLEIIYED